MQKYPILLDRFLLLPLFLLVFINVKSSRAEIPKQLLENDQCIICHKENEMLPEDFQEYDVHLQAGLSCAGCHGGDPTAEDQEKAMSPAKGFVGVPTHQAIPHFCGKCHSDIDFMRKYKPGIQTDQVRQFYTSVHGKKLKKGDRKVAECASCHTAHAIAAVADARSSVYPLNIPNTCKTCHADAEYMKPYRIPTDQFDKYARSVHGEMLLKKGDIGAPACNDCHGNHGAQPPGIESVSHICGICHVNNMNYFTDSPMAEAFAQSDLLACEQCHGYHEVKKTSDEMVGVGDSSTCTSCHEAGDKGYIAAQKMYGLIKALSKKTQLARTKLQEVKQKGMNDADILFLIQDGRQALVKTRTLIHTFDPEKIRVKTEEGQKKISEAIQLADKEIKDFHTRRKGFGIATFFIVILAIALYIKIREMEKKKQEA